MQIIAANGESYSGQTPDIPGDKLHKKCFPRTKIWHGKRFSWKIDGVEVGIKSVFEVMCFVVSIILISRVVVCLPSSACIYNFLGSKTHVSRGYFKRWQ